MFEKRIHLYRDVRRKKRTTVSLEDYLYELLVIHLGYTPDSEGARVAVKDWLQDRLYDDYDKDRDRVSQFLRKRIIFELMDKDLSKKHEDWRLGEDF